MATSISSHAISRAIENIINYGDTDIFPYPFENILIRRNPEEFQKCIEHIAQDIDAGALSYPPQFEHALVPVGYNGYRWGTQICPFWNTLLLASVLDHSGNIKKSRLSVKERIVHSYRISNTAGPNIFDENFNWVSFMRDSYALAKTHKFVIITDISEFYRRVYLHRTENALEQAIGKQPTAPIMSVLNLQAGRTSYGLPIGGPAARILSEITLNQIDQLLYSSNFPFVRFSDDFHLFSNSIEDCHKKIHYLTEILIVNQGLTLQKSKTRIVSSAEFVATFPKHLISEPEDDATDRERLFNISLAYDPYSATAEEDYNELQKELEKIDFLKLLNEELQKSQVHGPTMQRLISAMKGLKIHVRRDAIATLFGNLSVLYPVLSNIFIMLLQLFDDLDDEEKETICSALVGIAWEDSYLLSLDIHKAYAARILSRFSVPGTRQVLKKWLSTYTSSLLRREILIAYIRLNEWSEVSNLKNYFVNLSAWERRAFIAASYILGDEGQHWRKRQSFNVFEKFIVSGAGSLYSKGRLVDLT